MTLTRRSPPGYPAPAGRRPTRQQMPIEMLVVFGTALLAGATMLWNIAASPDTQYDEIVYTRAAQQVAQDWRLTWTNEPMFVHPPLSFLAQAGWLRLLGMGQAPLEHAIVAARVLTAGAMVFAILLVGLLAAHLADQAGRRRGLVIVAVVAALAATDPVLLRYGRLAMIEPLALIVALLTLCLAIWLRERRPLVYVPVVGLATGLTLLTKEVTAFLVFTPVIYHLLAGRWRRVGAAFGAFVWGLGLWLLFPLWALALGETSTFVAAKFSMLERLTGLLQITGWNRKGSSFVSAVADQAGQYGTTYLVLGLGAVALVWLLLSATSGPARWLLAWLLTSYAFAGYSVLLGTLNEQFFVYLMPAAIVGTVLMGDAALARLVTARRAGGAGSAALGLAAMSLAACALLGLALVSWARFYLPANDGIFRATAFLRTQLPTCTVFTTTAEPDRFTHLLPGRNVAAFATGPGALSHGVHVFVVSDKDVASGTVAPDLPGWVRARGTLLGSFPSATYGGLQVWNVPGDPYDPFADVETTPAGFFVTTQGSRCAGYPVVDGPAGAFAEAWQQLGGKAMVGPPLTAVFSAESTTRQVFLGAVLTNQGLDGVAPMPIVATLAGSGAYRNAQLPPVTTPSGAEELSDAQVRAQLTDPVIAAAYLGGRPAGVVVPASTTTPGDGVGQARILFGEPIGPATRMPDGVMRQAFGNVVFEYPAGGRTARLAPVGRLAVEAGVVSPPAAAGAAVPPPPLPPAIELGPDQPTSVKPFVITLVAGLAVYVALPAALELILVQLRANRRRAS